MSVINLPSCESQLPKESLQYNDTVEPCALLTVRKVLAPQPLQLKNAILEIHSHSITSAGGRRGSYPPPTATSLFWPLSADRRAWDQCDQW